MTRASILSVKELLGSRSDGKRPDGLTLIPWSGGRSATWDVTVTDTVQLHLILPSQLHDQLLRWRQPLSARTPTTAISLETMGPINEVGQDFISQMGHRIFSITEDPRETSFLFQRLSVAVQRLNAVCFSDSFNLDYTDLANRPKHT